MSDEMLGNGIDAATGAYLFPEESIATLAQFARRIAIRNADRDRDRAQKRTSGHFALSHDGNPNALDQAGWALVFPNVYSSERRQSIKDLLAPLLARRRSQVKSAHYKELEYHPGWDVDTFLTHHGAGPGAAESDKVPYYLLLVASPAEIPFDLQYGLSIQYAVGRIHFDNLDGYRRYAEAVVAVEESGRTGTPSAAFFGVDHDRATRRSAGGLIAPLSDFVARRTTVQVTRHMGADASKATLSRLLGGRESPPWLLFTASHGLGLLGQGRELTDQKRRNGALLCQDWPGQGTPAHDHFFAADDMADDANLRGLIAFNFACFGAGTPALNSFHEYDQLLERVYPERTFAGRQLAQAPFLARLPMRLLEQGALCVIGHVDRTWSTCFQWKTATGADFRYTTTFENVLSRLLNGRRAGHAMEYFGLLGATLGARIAAMQHSAANPMRRPIDDAEWAYTFMCWHNARNFILLGDPAVQMPLAEPEKDGAAQVDATESPDVQPGVQPDVQPNVQPNVLLDSNAEPALFSRDPEERHEPSRAPHSRFISEVKAAVASEFTGDADQFGSLEIRTYESDAELSPENPFAGARLRAVTRFGQGGDTATVVPRCSGAVDEALWAIHRDMVSQARAHHAEIVKLLTSQTVDRESD